MSTYYVEPAMLGDEATQDDAARMVALLNERGYEAELGSSLQNGSEDEIPQRVWDECLDIISRETYA